jgi:hypothetical protein
MLPRENRRGRHITGNVRYGLENIGHQVNGDQDANTFHR